VIGLVEGGELLGGARIGLHDAVGHVVDVHREQRQTQGTIEVSAAGQGGEG